MIRWKPFFFERQCVDNDETTPNFGFKSVKTTPKNDNLNQFESNLYNMVQNIEFKKVKFNFQMQLSNDIKIIKTNPQLIIPGDKTNNLCELTTEEYNKLLIENIIKAYKKITVSAINAINTETKAIAKDYSLHERIEQYNQNQSFRTIQTMQTNKSCKNSNRYCKQTLHQSDKQIN